MRETTIRDNETLVAFWDQAFFIPEEAKEAARQEGAGPWEEMAPSEALLRAVCELGGRKKVLDYGCGNGWAAIAAAKSGCPDVTASDAAPHAVEMTGFLAELMGVSEQVHPVCCAGNWLKNIPAETYDGLICSNVLDVVPVETAEEILRELSRVVTPDAKIVVGLNYYLAPEAAAERAWRSRTDAAFIRMACCVWSPGPMRSGPRSLPPSSLWRIWSTSPGRARMRSEEDCFTYADSRRRIEEQEERTWKSSRI